MMFWPYWLSWLELIFDIRYNRYTLIYENFSAHCLSVKGEINENPGTTISRTLCKTRNI